MSESRMVDDTPTTPFAIVLSQQEAEELYRYTVNDYINPNLYPALMKLLARLSLRFAPRA